ncbi:hypothetical protein Q3O97_15830 [Ralstonia pseudosolanacearum]|uniref:hypothetical protein n=1 Tax=Ralstonia pseudosolanacearum TaxID=1310165 RepID=UPI0026FEBC10|nr:hypothetical protein [Ralstonia pseudosolanacearum]MDO3617321.1 hypothetical protein [Ralstonia pseudosolanacearum]
MTGRLETIALHVAEQIRTASPEQQHAAAVLACRLALEATSFNEALTSQALLALVEHRALPDGQAVKLSKLAQELDDRYFDLQDLADSGPEQQQQALRFFGQARAVSALLLAHGPDPLEAAMEAVYEATATMDDPATILDSVLSLFAEP